ncbi:MAG: alpha/beta fold hydrolase [Fimbriimonadaceae bacterium]|nr:alpha/beta fold hydrolase [Fimbriimonadaceae bacterium]
MPHFIATLSLIVTGTDAMLTAPIRRLEAEDVRARCQELFATDANLADPVHDRILLIKASYGSRDATGKIVRQSGLIAYPSNGAPRGTVVFYHGTRAYTQGVPSRMTRLGAPGTPPSEAEIAVLAFATAGYVVVAPDYLGLGDHRGVHPYPLGAVNAPSGMDLAKAIPVIFRSPNPDMFVTGYSEGGAVAMWAARQYGRQVTAVAPLSGPYDLTGATLDGLLASQRDFKQWAPRVYLAAYLGYSSATYARNTRLEDIFTPSFASYVRFLWKQDLPDDKLVLKLVGKAVQLGANRNLDRLIADKFKTPLAKRDRKNPVIALLAANNVYDWAPAEPTYMVCLKSDNIVNPENTYRAYAAMRKRGVPPQRVNYARIVDPKLDHGSAALPALMLARRFFDGGMNAVPTEGN